jgi:hypothetical protein
LLPDGPTPIILTAAHKKKRGRRATELLLVLFPLDPSWRQGQNALLDDLQTLDVPHG